MLIRSVIAVCMFVVMTMSLEAQLCSGSLGDPIVNITFGSGANPGPSLSAATTFYQYQTGDCPSDGLYTVRNNTSACFGNSWQSISTDHTGDANGYFMLVNASIQPGAFYVDTVKGLCGNTTFEFAAWIMNVLLTSACSGSGTEPNLTFTIEKTDGTLIQSYNTNNIPSTVSPTWKQYGFFFTSPPAGADIVLRIVNNAPGGCGNDLALDDITFRPCGPQITNNIDGVLAAPIALCVNESHSYALNCTVSGGFLTPSYQWQVKTPLQPNWTDITGANSNSFTYTFTNVIFTGSYQLRLAVAESGNLGTSLCRVYSAPFSFIVNDNPITTATNDGPVCVGGTLNLSATGGTDYSWAGPNSFNGSGSPLPLVNIQSTQTGKYYVTVKNSAGCSHKDSTIITVKSSPAASTGNAETGICLGDSTQLTAGGGDTYLWSPATGLSDAAIANPKASPAATTIFTVTVTNTIGCTDTASSKVNVVTKPVAHAGPDRVMLLNHGIQLIAGSNDTSNIFTWQPDDYMNDFHLLQPTVNPPSDIRYILTATSNIGCGSASDTVDVKVFNDLYIPSAFTPTGNTTNRTWNIPALAAYSHFTLSIYNRFGQMVFQTNSTPVAWDGTFKGELLPMGTYVYFIDFGRNKNVVKGTVMLVR